MNNRDLCALNNTLERFVGKDNVSERLFSRVMNEIVLENERPIEITEEGKKLLEEDSDGTTKITEEGSKIIDEVFEKPAKKEVGTKKKK